MALSRLSSTANIMRTLLIASVDPGLATIKQLPEKPVEVYSYLSQILSRILEGRSYQGIIDEVQNTLSMNPGLMRSQEGKEIVMRLESIEKRVKEFEVTHRQLKEEFNTLTTQFFEKFRKSTEILKTNPNPPDRNRSMIQLFQDEMRRLKSFSVKCESEFPRQQSIEHDLHQLNISARKATGQPTPSNTFEPRLQ